MDIVGLGYIGFNSIEVDAWETLAPEVYGFELPPRSNDGTLYMKMDDRAWRIAIHPGEEDEVSYLGWELRGRLEFEAAVAEINDKGFKCERADSSIAAARSVSEVAVFHDPAGFRHEIYYAQIFEPGSFRPGRAMSGKFVTGDMGLGHAILTVPEVTDELRNFAVEVMGFKIFAGYRVVDARGKIMGMEFYRCNRRSHVMGYLPSGNLRGLTHIGIDVESMDDVGRAWDMVQERDIPIKMTLGRHMMDSLISFYIRSPSGFELEYGAGGDELDEGNFTMQKPTKPEVWGHKFGLEGWGSTVKVVEPE